MGGCPCIKRGCPGINSLKDSLEIAVDEEMMAWLLIRDFVQRSTFILCERWGIPPKLTLLLVAHRSSRPLPAFRDFPYPIRPPQDTEPDTRCPALSIT